MVSRHLHRGNLVCLSVASALLLGLGGVMAPSGALAAAGPVATTGPIENLQETSAVATGSVDATNSTNGGLWYFIFCSDQQWQLHNCGAETPSHGFQGHTNQSVSDTMTGLEPGTLYHYQLFAGGFGETSSYGGWRTFTTGGNGPNNPNAHHYRVEIKAWIPFPQVVDPRQPFSGSYLGFPPFGGVEDNCYSPPWWAQFNEVALSTYRGDAHTGYDGGWRVLAAVEFDWDGHNITNFQGPGALGYPIYGQSQRLIDYLGLDGHHQCVAASGTATHSVVGTTTGNTFDLEIHSANPLVNFPPAPDIDSNLTGTMTADGTVQFHIVTDRFPSHGVRVYRDGQVLGTEIVNDASCLGQDGVLGLTGLLVIGEGLTSQDADHSGFISYPATAGNIDIQSGLCKLVSTDAVAVYLPGQPVAVSATASAASVRIAASRDGKTPAGRFMTPAAAERRRLVVVARSGGNTLILGSADRPFVVETTGVRRVLMVLRGRRGQSRTSRFLLNAGAALISPLASRAPLVKQGNRVRPVMRRWARPRTHLRVLWHRGSNLRVAFTVTSTFGVAGTYVVNGTQPPRRIHNGTVIRRRRGVITYYSVDLLGDIERPHRLR